MTALTAATGFCARFLVSVLVSFASVRRCSRGARAARPGAVRVARLWVECAERSLSCGLDLPGSGATSGRGRGFGGELGFGGSPGLGMSARAVVLACELRLSGGSGLEVHRGFYRQLTGSACGDLAHVPIRPELHSMAPESRQG